MTLRLIVSFAADLFAVILMIWLLNQLKKLPMEKDSLKQYFQRFSLVVLLMSILHLISSYSELQLGGLTEQEILKELEKDFSGWVLAATAASVVDIFLCTVFICMWLSFISWFLFEDKDFIRRKFWVGFVPLIIAAAVTAVTIPMAISSELGFIIFFVAIVLFFLIRIAYFLMALWLLKEYKRQNGYKRFFNPWLFFVPVFAGWILQDLFSWGFTALGSTLGVVLFYISITSEERYVDKETGFYNIEMVNYLKDLVNKGKYDTHSTMNFALENAGDMKEFSKILKKQLPKDCEPILKNDREVVVLTNVQNRMPLLMVIDDVKAEKEVKASTVLKKKTETTLEFMERSCS